MPELILYILQQHSMLMPPRVKVTLINPEDHDDDIIVDPLIVVVRHLSGVISWQLPYMEKLQEIRFV